MRIPGQQFVYCQSLIKSEVLNAVRSRDKLQEYKSIENKINFLVKKRNDLMNRIRTDFWEVETRLQNLERNDCTNFSKLNNYDVVVSGNYNVFIYVLCLRFLYENVFNNLLIFL